MSSLLVFKSEDRFVEAMDVLKSKKEIRFEVYSAYDVKSSENFTGSDSAINAVKFACLLGAVVGVFIGFGMPWYATVVDNPLNSGGRPLNSWPVYVPITFVLTVLCTGLAGFTAFLMRLGFPRPYAPVFDFSQYHLDRSQFYIYVRAELDEETLRRVDADEIEELP